MGWQTTLVRSGRHLASFLMAHSSTLVRLIAPHPACYLCHCTFFHRRVPGTPALRTLISFVYYVTTICIHYLHSRMDAMMI